MNKLLEIILIALISISLIIELKNLGWIKIKGKLHTNIESCKAVLAKFFQTARQPNYLLLLEYRFSQSIRKLCLNICPYFITILAFFYLLHNESSFYGFVIKYQHEIISVLHSIVLVVFVVYTARVILTVNPSKYRGCIPAMFGLQVQIFVFSQFIQAAPKEDYRYQIIFLSRLLFAILAFLFILFVFEFFIEKQIFRAVNIKEKNKSFYVEVSSKYEDFLLVDRLDVINKSYSSKCRYDIPENLTITAYFHIAYSFKRFSITINKGFYSAKLAPKEKVYEKNSTAIQDK